MNALTPELWDRMRARLLTESTISDEARTLLSQSLNQVQQSNEVKIELDTSLVTESFLAFLKEQIALEPRGPAWSEVLRRRLKSLAEYVGHEHIRITVRQDKTIITARFKDLSSLELVHYEEV